MVDKVSQIFLQSRLPSTVTPPSSLNIEMSPDMSIEASTERDGINN